LAAPHGFAPVELEHLHEQRRRDHGERQPEFLLLPPDLAQRASVQQRDQQAGGRERDRHLLRQAGRQVGRRHPQPADSRGPVALPQVQDQPQQVEAGAKEFRPRRHQHHRHGQQRVGQEHRTGAQGPPERRRGRARRASPAARQRQEHHRHQPGVEPVESHLHGVIPERRVTAPGVVDRIRQDDEGPIVMEHGGQVAQAQDRPVVEHEIQVVEQEGGLQGRPVQDERSDQEDRGGGGQGGPVGPGCGGGG